MRRVLRNALALHWLNDAVGGKKKKKKEKETITSMKISVFHICSTIMKKAIMNKICNAANSKSKGKYNVIQKPFLV